MSMPILSYWTSSALLNSLFAWGTMWRGQRSHDAGNPYKLHILIALRLIVFTGAKEKTLSLRQGTIFYCLDYSFYVLVTQPLKTIPL